MRAGSYKGEYTPGDPRRTLRTGVLSPLAIFDQYYKNQPTDFLREILPPRVPEYFITVHVLPRLPKRMLRPFFLPPAGTERRREGGDKTKRKIEEAETFSFDVLLCRAFRSRGKNSKHQKKIRSNFFS